LDEPQASENEHLFTQSKNQPGRLILNWRIFYSISKNASKGPRMHAMSPPLRGWKRARKTISR